MSPHNRIRTGKVFLTVLLLCASSCLADWGEPDADISKMPLEKLQSTAEYCYVTSKGRELRMFDSENYIKDLAVRRLKNSAAILKDEDEKTVSEMLRVVEIEEREQKFQFKEEERLRTWLEQNCVDGTSLYLYSRTFDNVRRSGYCVAKNGTVVDSFSLGDGLVDPTAPIYTVPPSLSIKVEAEPTQPSGYPVVVTLALTGIGKTPFSYWCGGPGVYPSVDRFTAKVTDDKGKVQGIHLENGQYVMGSGVDREIKPGEMMNVPATLGLLPAGSYTIQVGEGKAEKVDVKVNSELAEKRKQELLLGIYKDEPFPQFVAVHYNIKPVIDALQNDLTGTNVTVALQAAKTFYGLDPTPDNFVSSINTAMQQQLKSTINNPKRIDLMFMLALLASNIGSDDAMIPVLDMLHSKTSGLNDDQRASVVGYLSGFKQERAKNELHGLLTDTNPEVQTRAAEVLASRKDSAGVQILRTQLFDKSSRNRYGAYLALLEFPDDPGYEALVKYGLDDTDDDIRRDANEAKEKLEKIRKFKNGN